MTHAGQRGGDPAHDATKNRGNRSGKVRRVRAVCVGLRGGGHSDRLRQGKAPLRHVLRWSWRCLGECPQGAITIVEREAQPFDETAVVNHHAAAAARPSHPPAPHACPGAAMRVFPLNVLPADAGTSAGESLQPPSADGLPTLSHWPIQLHLVPPTAPFLRDAELFLVADCVPFACGEFHRRILRCRPIVIGCPKLDDGRAYVQKLADIFRQSGLRSLTVVHMEVPCCTNLVRIAAEAVRLSGVLVPLAEITIARSGEILEGVPSGGR